MMNRLTNRREFVLSLTAPLLAQAAPPRRDFPTAPRERLAIASYSFRSLIDTPRNRARAPQATLIPLRDLAAQMARRYNIRAVELLGQHFPSTEPEALADLRLAVKAAGSRIVNIPTSLGVSVYDPDPARRSLAIVNAKKWIDVAVAVACPSVRLHIQGGKDFPPDAALATETLRTISAYGEQQDVVVNLENDDPVTEDAFFITRILDAAQTPWLRALPDFCNSMLKNDEKFNYEAVTAMFHRAYNISHVKDSEVDGKNTWRVDLARTFAIAKAAGYEGWFSIEWEGAGDVWEENARLIEESVRLMEAR